MAVTIEKQFLRSRPFPPASANAGVVCLRLSMITLVATVILCVLVTAITGPTLWVVASSASAILAGKILTYIAIATVTSMLFIMIFLCCCSCVCSINEDMSVKMQHRDIVRQLKEMGYGETTQW